MTQRTALGQLSHDMYTTGGLSARVTKSPPQAQQGFAESTLDTYVQPQDSVERLSLAHAPHSSETQREKVAESGSPHTAQGLSRRRQLSLAPTHSTGTHQKNVAESGSPQ